jgi:hypothetical protein
MTTPRGTVTPAFISLERFVAFDPQLAGKAACKLYQSGIALFYTLGKCAYTKRMHNLGLILPAGVAAVSLLQVIIFVVVAIILPGTLLALVLNNFGIQKKGRRLHVKKYIFIKKLVGVIVYHLTMLLIWLVSWPQFSSPVHTGYALSFGLLYLLGIMIVWTATGMLLIYGWNLLQKKNIKFPRFGFFLRLYIWNLFIMFIFREILYWKVNH